MISPFTMIMDTDGKDIGFGWVELDVLVRMSGFQQSVKFDEAVGW